MRVWLLLSLLSFRSKRSSLPDQNVWEVGMGVHKLIEIRDNALPDRNRTGDPQLEDGNVSRLDRFSVNTF